MDPEEPMHTRPGSIVQLVTAYRRVTVVTPSGRSSFNVTASGLEVAAPEIDPDRPPKEHWRGVLAVEDKPTGDGRMFEGGALGWDADLLPLPLLYVRQDQGDGHAGQEVVGWIDQVTRSGSEIRGEGRFDLDTEIGREAARQVDRGLMPGVSVDVDDVAAELRVAAELLAFDEDEPVEVEVPTDEEDEDEPDDRGMVTVMEFSPDDELLVTTDARLRAATIVALPAFVEARLETYVPEGEEIDDDPDGEEDEDAPDAVAASQLVAGSVSSIEEARAPAAWFEDPQLDGPTGITVTDDGRVFGHIASWNTCHTAFPDECLTPPRSAAGYAYFRTGAVRTREGGEVATGRLTVDTSHAGRRLGAADTAGHYEHTGLAVADVAAGEDAHGIWVAGAVRPGATPEQVAALRASPISGDWRRIGGSLELVAALAVNSPGFPVPRVLVASGELQSVQALGALPPSGDEPGGDDDSERLLARILDRERRAQAEAKAEADRVRARVLVASARAKARG